MQTGGHVTLAVSAVFLLLLCCSLVGSTTVLELQLVKYANVAEKRYDGLCCDALCISSCDHRFKFCVDQNREYDYDIDHCTIQLLETGEFPEQNVIQFGTHMAGLLNPILVDIDDWPGVVDFKVRVEEDDGWYSARDLVDKLKVSIAGPVYKNKSSAKWTNVFLLGVRSNDRTTLEMNFRVYCKQHFYGADCKVQCQPHSDIVNGFYTCHPDTGSKVCNLGYLPSTGCMQNMDNCLGNVCKNGATCVDLENTYDCTCTPGYTGGYCELLVDKCNFNPCRNNARCETNGADYICHCPDGYVGKNCNVHVCSMPTTCLNGGTCYGSGLCRCAVGFQGSDCGDSDTGCGGRQCQNGGTCEAGKCFCRAGFIGADCSISQCQVTQCLNGGTCVSGLCRCKPGFVGASCETDTGPCQYRPCLHGGMCLDQPGGSYVCHCLPGYHGRLCESRNPNAAEVSSGTGAGGDSKRETYNVNLEGWHIALLVFGIALIIALLLIALLVTRHRRKSRLVERNSTVTSSEVNRDTRQADVIDETHHGAGAGAGADDSFDNPLFLSAHQQQHQQHRGNAYPHGFAGGASGGRGGAGAGPGTPGGAVVIVDGLDVNVYDSPMNGREVVPALPVKTLPPDSHVSVYQHPPKPRAVQSSRYHFNDNVSTISSQNAGVYEDLNLDMGTHSKAMDFNPTVTYSIPDKKSKKSKKHKSKHAVK